jgi:hypothetical protein
MRAPEPPPPKLGELIERLVDEGGNLLRAEVRIAEAKLTRRMRLAAPPLGMLAVAAMLALIALMAAATALIVLLAQVAGVLAATLIVTVLAAAAGYALYRVGSQRLRAVIEMPATDTRDR